jgi:hypothetical protein
MPQNRMNPQPEQDENIQPDQNAENVDTERFESDTQKIIRRHLENKDDIITDEDIAGVRVGLVPPEFDSATAARFEDEEGREDVEEEVLGDTQDTKTDENLEDDQITPWDTVDPAK